MKIRIKDPEHSKRVQQALFKLGCKWANDSTRISCTHARALYVEAPDAHHDYPYIMWNSADEEDFEDSLTDPTRFENCTHSEYHLNTSGEFVEGPEPTLQELLKDKIAVMGECGGPEIDWGKLAVSSDSIKFVTIGMPVQVRTRKEVTVGRIKELLEGAKYKLNKGEAIPEEWVDELTELNGDLKYFLSNESKEK